MRRATSAMSGVGNGAMSGVISGVMDGIISGVMHGVIVVAMTCVTGGVMDGNMDGAICVVGRTAGAASPVNTNREAPDLAEPAPLSGLSPERFSLDPANLLDEKSVRAFT
jgi:hypothetical protein